MFGPNCPSCRTFLWIPALAILDWSCITIQVLEYFAYIYIYIPSRTALPLTLMVTIISPNLLCLQSFTMHATKANRSLSNDIWVCSLVSSLLRNFMSPSSTKPALEFNKYFISKYKLKQTSLVFISWHLINISIHFHGLELKSCSYVASTISFTNCWVFLASSYSLFNKMLGHSQLDQE